MVTARAKAQPLKTGWTHGFTPARLRPDTQVATKKTPTAVPTTLN